MTKQHCGGSTGWRRLTKRGARPRQGSVGLPQAAQNGTELETSVAQVTEIVEGEPAGKGPAEYILANSESRQPGTAPPAPPRAEQQGRGQKRSPVNPILLNQVLAWSQSSRDKQ